MIIERTCQHAKLALAAYASLTDELLATDSQQTAPQRAGLGFSATQAAQFATAGWLVKSFF